MIAYILIVISSSIIVTIQRLMQQQLRTLLNESIRDTFLPTSVAAYRCEIVTTEPVMASIYGIVLCPSIEWPIFFWKNVVRFAAVLSQEAWRSPKD